MKIVKDHSNALSKIWSRLSCRVFVSALLVFLIQYATNAQSPGNVSGLHLWLKADAGVSGTAPITAWSDQTSTHADAVPGISTAPDFVSDAINFNPVLDFDAADQLEIANGILGTNTYGDIWVYAVSQHDQTGNTRQTLREDLAVGGWDAEISYDNVRSEVGNGAVSTGAMNISLSSYSFWSFGSSSTANNPNGENKCIYRDGELLASNTLSRTATGDNADFVIGDNLDGKIAELIVFTQAPTSEENERIQSYLAIKYGITKISEDLTSTLTFDERDYLASDEAVIWDYSANAGYSNDIVGIGRDDATGLNQQKSINSNISPFMGTTIDLGGAFASDMTYLLWGHDGAFGISKDLSGYDARTARIWKVAVTGTPGSTDLSIDLSGTGLDLKRAAADFTLLTDADGDFTSGSSADATGASLTDGVLTFSNVSFSDGDYFTVAGPALPSSPGKVSDHLFLWLRADEGVSGTTPITAWSDHTGAQADAAPAISTAPDFVSDAINFNPVLDFDAADQLEIGNGLLGAGEYDDLWVYSVSQHGNTSNIRQTFHEDLVSRQWNAQVEYSEINMAVGYGYLATGVIDISSSYSFWSYGSSSTGNNPNGENKCIYRDGELLASNDDKRISIGKNSDFIIGDNLNGKIGELIVYTQAPTSVEHERIQSYLAIKYGITKISEDLTSTLTFDERDYLASDETVIWDYSANTGYDNNIVGIGRDDATGLDQRKSINSNTTPFMEVTIDLGGAFASDMSYLLWGHDGASGISKDLSGYDARTARIWKVAVTGTPGSTDLSIDLSSTGLDLKRAAADFTLLTDADGDFTSGASADATGASLTNGVLTFSNVSFSDGDYFTVAGPELPSSPGKVSDHLFLWLRADEGVSGTTPITAWSDHTGAQTDAAPAMSTAPDFVSDAINFNPVLDFDAADQLEIGNGLLGTGEYDDLWVYSVSQHDNTSNVRKTFYEDLVSRQWNARVDYSNVKMEVSYGSLNTGVIEIDTDSYSFWSYGSSSTGNNPDGENKCIYRDGELLASNDDKRMSRGKNSDFIIGDNLDGKIGELIVYTQAPTSVEHERIQSYLAIKYGITKISEDLTSTLTFDERDYLASDETVIWDYSPNTGYNDEIVGIGRDDDNSLNQKQTKVQNDSLAVFISSLSTSNAANTGTISSDRSYIIIGHDAGLQRTTAASDLELPSGIMAKVEREWKIANTNFTNDFGVDLLLDLTNAIDPSDLRLLVDDDGDFSNATIYGPADGLTIVASTDRTYTISGISNTFIPANTTRYIAIGVLAFTIDPIADVTLDENTAYTSVTPSLTGGSPIGDVTYTLGGADAASFTIDSGTGVVYMVARDFENPEDTNADNVYEVSITATDEDNNSDAEDWTITIQDVNETATFTIASMDDESWNENNPYTSATPVLIGDAPIGDVTYTLGGTDAASFTVDPGTGVVYMVARDFENPEDTNADNVYEVSITATDEDNNSDAEDWTITIQDVNETATFTIASMDDESWNENNPYTSATPVLIGDAPIGDVTYTLGGTDAASFTVDPGTGVVSMVARDFENPEDTNADNVYEVSITATDEDNNSDAEDWTITIQDVNETATFTIASIDDESWNENNSYESGVPVLSGDTPIGNVTYSLGGTDAASFTINASTGVISMVARDFENPEDTNEDNVYECSVIATDEGDNTATEDWTVTILDVSFSIAAIENESQSENTSYTSVSPTLIGDAPVGDVTYTLGGADFSSFTIDTSAGVVSMVARDFENPEDVNADNVYEIEITATDEEGSISSEEWSVTILDEDDTSIIIPNAFTPNRDNENDLWEITNLSDNSSVSIFNRNGTILFQSVGYQNPWDGYYKGKLLPMDTYYYLVKDGDSQFRGYVIILR